MEWDLAWLAGLLLAVALGVLLALAIYRACATLDPEDMLKRQE